MSCFRCEGARRGSFQFEVSDGESVAGPPQSFVVVATPLRLRLEVLRTLDAFPGIVQPITAGHLRAVTNDPNQTRPVVFTLRTEPRLGRLVKLHTPPAGTRLDGSGSGDVLERSSTFSQADVDARLVGYEHTAPGDRTAWSQTDSFTFDVSTRYQVLSFVQCN